MVKALKVWMNGEAVGVWSVDGGGGHRFRYEPSWRESRHARPVSRAIPLDAAGVVEGPAVGRWFEGLLPEDARHRLALQVAHRAASVDPFDLLAVAGRDCVGAVQLLPDDAPPAPSGVRSTPLGAREVEDLLREATAGGGASPSTLPGVLPGGRDKIALMRIGAAWHRPLDSTPSTHILKLPSGRPRGEARFDLATSVANEWFCLRFLRALGLPAARAEIARFGDVEALLVERFDRAWEMGDAPRIVRLPQEDLGQALGASPEAKYEAEGGPGIRAVLPVLADSSEPSRDGRIFVAAQFAFWLLAALDGHARNFSMFVHRGGRTRLAPLYDVVSAWPAIGGGPHGIAPENARMAMAIGGGNAHVQLFEIGPQHWRDLASATAVPQAWDALVAVSGRVEEAIAGTLAQAGASFPSDLSEAIVDGIRRQNAIFRQAL